MLFGARHVGDASTTVEDRDFVPKSKIPRSARDVLLHRAEPGGTANAPRAPLTLSVRQRLECEARGQRRCFKNGRGFAVFFTSVADATLSA